MGCPKDERSSSQKWHQAPRVAPEGPAVEHPSLEFGDLGIWGPVRGQGPGSAERPRCFRVPVPLCWGDAASLLLPRRAPHPHTSSCSPGEGTAWGGDTQGGAAEGRPEPCVGFQLRCSPGCAHSRTHGALKSHIILGALTPQTPLAQNLTLLTHRAGGEQETQSSAALVVRRGISPPLMSSAASRNAPQVKRAQGKTLRAPLPLSQTRNRLLS